VHDILHYSLRTVCSETVGEHYRTRQAVTMWQNTNTYWGNTEEANSSNTKTHYSNWYWGKDYILQLRTVGTRGTIQTSQTCWLCEGKHKMQYKTRYKNQQLVNSAGINREGLMTGDG